MVAGLGGAVAAARRASGAYEDLSKFAAVFKGESAAVSAELTQFAHDIGRSRFEMLKMAGGIQDTFVPLGFARDTAADMSVQLTRLSEDLASFNNLAGGGTEASQRLTSALVGNHEAVRTFGIVITEARLKEELLRMGMADLTGQALEQAKVQARLNIIMRDTADAQGDAARTATQAENAQRRFTSSISETFTGLGLVVLPIWRELMNALADFAQSVGPRIVQGAEDMVRGWLQRLGSMEAGTARSLGRTAGFIFAFGQQVVKWGANIVMALAQGITGAINLVVSAVKLIGKVIASLLSPGSPPALLPDLDKWGTEAANVYLEGWTQADFGILDEVGRQVRGIIQGQGAEGEGLIGRVAGTRQAVANAIQRFRQTGQVGVEAYQRIRDAAGGAAEAVVGLVKRQIDLAKASQRVKEINEALSAIEEQRQSIHDAQRLADIQERLAQGGLSAQEEQLALLDAQEIQLKSQLRSAQDEQDERQTELDIFKERLGVQQESLSLTQSLADALAQASGAAGKIKEGIAGLGDSLRKEIEAGIPDLEDLGLVPSFEEEFASIRELIDEEFKPGFLEGERIAAEFATNVEDSINELLVDLGLIREEDPLAFLGGESTDEAQRQEGLFARIGESVRSFGSALSRLSDIIDNLDTEKIDLIAKAVAAIGITLVAFKVVGLLLSLASAIGTIAGIASSAIGAISGIAGIIGTAASVIGGSGIIGLIEGFIGIIASINPIFLIIAAALAALKIAWDRDLGGIATKTKEFWDEYIDPVFGDWDKFLNEILPGAIQLFKDDFERLIINPIKNQWNKTIQTLTNAWEAVKKKINELTGEDGPLHLLRVGFDQVKAGLDFLIGEDGPIARFIGWIDSMIKKVKKGKEWLDKLPFIGQSPPPMEGDLKLVNEQLDQFVGRLESVGSTARRLGRNLSDHLVSILPGSPPPLAEGLRDVADATRELAGQGRRRLMRFLQAGQQAGQRNATLVLTTAWAGLQAQITDTQDSSEDFADFWQRDVQEDTLEATDDFLRSDMIPSFEDLADLVQRVLVRAFERLSRQATTSVSIVGPAVEDINDLIAELDVGPLEAIEGALQGVQAALADVAANLPVLEQIRDVLSQIDAIDIQDIIIELGLSAELTARFDSIDLDLTIIQDMINDVRNLVLDLGGGGIGLQTAGAPVLASTTPQFSGATGGGETTQVVNQNTFGPFYVSDDMDMEIVARRIARIIQDLS